MNDSSSLCMGSSSGFLFNNLREMVFENMKINKNVIIELVEEIFCEKRDFCNMFVNKIYCLVKEIVDSLMRN